mmetsp:Transcript_2725/g.6310  ORF Transcript_2725/g.6310 Transcript_2725/m.6310 type:complete len:166 (-) Transcript_2725:188-685(-)
MTLHDNLKLLTINLPWTNDLAIRSDCFGKTRLAWLQVALDEHVTVGTAPITSPNLAEPSAASNELHSLPYTLPGLLASPSWAGSREAVVSYFVGMLANLDRPQQQQLFATAKAAVLACLRTLRNVVQLPNTGSTIQQRADGGSNLRAAVADMVYETAASQIAACS